MSKPTFAQTALVLQGGGALGAYQAGVYEAFAAHDCEPDWFSGISIGAINAAIMAGNEPRRRVARLQEFWEEVTSNFFMPAPHRIAEFRSVFNSQIAGLITVYGARGFFLPRFPPAISYPQGSSEALSIYDSSPLRATLLKLVDFDRINAQKSRISLGAVGVRTGNFIYFDNTERTIGPEHVMASAAIPPGLPPIEIDGELYWDGGLVSNTPLTQVLDRGPDRDTLVFQVDLFGARGPVPRDLFEAEERRKDIVYSSRTRLVTDVYRKTYAQSRAIQMLYDLLTPEQRQNPGVQALRALGGDSTARVAIVHLIYRRKPYESHAKDYEFSRSSMRDHWKAGFEDASVTLANPRWDDPAPDADGIRVFDLTRDQEGPFE
jgi:NTE family protein